MSEKRGLMHRLFAEHPQALGMGWSEHAIGALNIGGRMISAGTACIVHAIVPGWFTETAGRTVISLHEYMSHRRAAAPDPGSWPEYEI